jgi:hypothetical protein
MASDVDLVNMALSILGDDPIVALTDNTARARVANVVYGPTRDAVLRAHPWNCATTRVALTINLTPPAFEWANSFALPANCLRVLSLNAVDQWGQPGYPFKIEGRNLLTNETVADIRYIFRPTDPSGYDTLLYDAIAYRLAGALAYPVTGSTAVVNGLLQIYEAKLKEARSINGQEGSPARFDIPILNLQR